MEPNTMIQVGLLPSQQLVSLLTDDDGNWRDVPEGQSVVPLVKIPKPTEGAWEPNVVWFEDRVERQWVAGTPAPVPTFTAEQVVAKYFSAYQIAALQRLEMALLQANKPLGPQMTAAKNWLESVMLGWAVDPTPKPTEGAWEPNVVWFEDRVERQWVAGTPVPLPTFTAEQIVSQYFSAYQIAALQRLEMALLQAGKPLGPQMTAAKQWLEAVMLGWAVDPTPKPAAAFGEPSVTFEQASAEAVAGLQSPNPET